MRHFRFSWRLLRQDALYSSVVIGGMAVAFCVAFLLAAFVRYSFSYDSSVPERERVFVLKHKINLDATPFWLDYVPMPLHEVLKESGLPLTSSVILPTPELVRAGALKADVRLTRVDLAFPSLLGLRAQQGDVDAALRRPDGLAITESTARRLFGAGPALGRSVQIRDKSMQVLAVLADPPSNATVSYQALYAPVSVLGDDEGQKRRWTVTCCKILVRPGPGVQPKALRKLLQDAVDLAAPKAYGGAKADGYAHVAEVELVPLSEAYFDTSLGTVDAIFVDSPRGDKRVVLAMAGLAVLIVLLACSNYVNLATVRTLERRREIGVRKVLGAAPKQLGMQFLTESVLVALLASGTGMLLAWLLLPWFSELVQRDLHNAFQLPVVALALLAALLAGLASGAYPAWLATRVSAQAVLAGRGKDDAGDTAWLRRALTVLQSAAAIALCYVGVSLAWQANYAMTRDPGFTPTSLHVVDLPIAMGGKEHSALDFADQVARLPGVDSASLADRALGSERSGGGDPFCRAGVTNCPTIDDVSGDPAYFEVHRIRLVAGRLFDPARSRAEQRYDIVISEDAVRVLGFASPAQAIGQILNQSASKPGFRIVGIAAPVQHRTAREGARPVVYHMTTLYAGVLVLRSALATPDLAKLLTPLLNRNYGDRAGELKLRSLPAVMADAYQDDVRAVRILTLGGALAGLIAGFGIYVLAAHSVQRRAREIVLRKLHGAGPGAIARLIAKEFGILTGVACALGLPLGFLISERYLAGFADRAAMGIAPLLIATSLAVLITSLACLRHTVQAMRMRPAALLASA